MALSWHRRGLVSSEEVAGGAGRSHGPESVLSVNECGDVGLLLLGKGQLDRGCLKASVLEASRPKFLSKTWLVAHWLLDLGKLYSTLSALVFILVPLGYYNKHIIKQAASKQVYFSPFWRLGGPRSGCQQI